MTAYNPAVAAAQGAVYLDTIRPSWFREIDLKTLDLDDPSQCILGQCFDDFWEGLRSLVPNTDNYVSDQHPFALTFSFNVPVSRQTNGNYERLGLAWKAEIRRRRKNRKR